VNHLGDESSSYLASAAHQPVHWRAWGAEAFEAAAAADRPVLLDIGAVWCHWCHVMDRESYEDADLAAFLNAHFVCIKVDRDERPDVDARYQRAVQAVAGQGGWPLTAFLTSGGDVFHGGTYFPPDARHGRPSFRAVLERVLEAWTTQRPQVLESASGLRRHVADRLLESAPGDVAPALLDAAAERIARAFDARHGGFGTQPKFPHPGAVEFLLARWWDTGEARALEIAQRTLDGMAAGGMHDQLGGGFHRYSVDERWVVPHFEKMAYDNAELLKAYVHAYAALGTPRYRAVAEGIVRWAFEVLADRERGGFGSSQDADVGLDDDGDHFTWTEDEARAALNPKEWEAARRHWDIGPDGEMHHDPRRNVLFVSRTAAQVAEEMGIAASEAEALLATAAVKLRAARALRPAPFVDRAVYASWNAMLADAFLEAGAVLERADCTAFALRTLERLWREAWHPRVGLAHRVGAVALTPLLDDQAHGIAALVSAYEHTGEPVWLDRAQDVARLALPTFTDPDGGGFFDAPAPTAEALFAVRAKSIQDNPSPSANAVMAGALLRLEALTGDATLGEAARTTLAAFAGVAEGLGVYGAAYLRTLDLHLRGATTIVVADTTTTSLAATALRAYRPRRVVLRHPSRVTPHPSPPAPPFALVCTALACAAPARTPSELREAMESFGRTG